MQVGSLVVVIQHEADESIKSYIKWYPVMDEVTPYIIKDMTESLGHKNITVATLEEGLIGEIITPDGVRHEIGVQTKYLIELMPPDDTLAELEDALTTPMVEYLT